MFTSAFQLLMIILDIDIDIEIDVQKTPKNYWGTVMFQLSGLCCIERLRSGHIQVHDCSCHLCRCICVCVCVHVRTYVGKYAGKQEAQVGRRKCMPTYFNWTYVRTSAHMYVHIISYAYVVHTCQRTYTFYTFTCTQTCTYTHTYTYIYIHIYIHIVRIRIHIHAHVQAPVHAHVRVCLHNVQEQVWTVLARPS